MSQSKLGQANIEFYRSALGQTVTLSHWTGTVSWDLCDLHPLSPVTGARAQQVVCVLFCFINLRVIDWCCFYYFLRNSLVALLEGLFARRKMGALQAEAGSFCPTAAARHRSRTSVSRIISVSRWFVANRVLFSLFFFRFWDWTSPHFEFGQKRNPQPRERRPRLP